MLRRLELSRSDHEALSARCRVRNIEFLSTPFDLESVDLLTEVGVRRLKLPSGDITNGPLLLKAARTGLPLILSTGMATVEDVREALGVIAFGFCGPGRGARDPGPLPAPWPRPREPNRSGTRSSCSTAPRNTPPPSRT